MEEGDRGGIGPKTGRNAKKEEEEEEGEEEEEEGGGEGGEGEEGEEEEEEEEEESIPAVGPTQPPIQWLQLQGREAKHSSPFSVKVQTASTLPSAFRMWCSRTWTDNFYFQIKEAGEILRKKAKTPKRLTE